MFEHLHSITYPKAKSNALTVHLKVQVPFSLWRALKSHNLVYIPLILIHHDGQINRFLRRIVRTNHSTAATVCVGEN